MPASVDAGTALRTYLVPRRGARLLVLRENLHKIHPIIISQAYNSPVLTIDFYQCHLSSAAFKPFYNRFPCSKSFPFYTFFSFVEPRHTLKLRHIAPFLHEKLFARSVDRPPHYLSWLLSDVDSGATTLLYLLLLFISHPSQIKTLITYTFFLFALAFVLALALGLVAKHLAHLHYCIPHTLRLCPVLVIPIVTLSHCFTSH